MFPGRGALGEKGEVTILWEADTDRNTVKQKYCPAEILPERNFFFEASTALLRHLNTNAFIMSILQGLMRFVPETSTE